MGMLGIRSYEGFSEGAKQDPTIWAHPIPRQEQGRGGSQGSPSSRHWARNGPSWDVGSQAAQGRAVRNWSPELLQGGSGRDWCFSGCNEPQQELGRNIRPLDDLQTGTGWTN